jgi:transcriptional regulator with XRE-family HTH domain
LRTYDRAVRDLYLEFGRRLRRARAGANLTQEELGAKVGLSRTSITNIERGRQHIPLHTLLRLSAATGVSPNTFVDGLPSEDASMDIPKRALRGVDDPRERAWVSRVLRSDPAADHTSLPKVKDAPR